MHLYVYVFIPMCTHTRSCTCLYLSTDVFGNQRSVGISIRWNPSTRTLRSRETPLKERWRNPDRLDRYPVGMRITSTPPRCRSASFRIPRASVIHWLLRPLEIPGFDVNANNPATGFTVSPCPMYFESSCCIKKIVVRSSWFNLANWIINPCSSYTWIVLLWGIEEVLRKTNLLFQFFFKCPNCPWNSGSSVIEKCKLFKKKGDTSG